MAEGAGIPIPHAHPGAATAERLFRGKVMLAPMVRAGTLPLRLLALYYGADTVYGEELIDHKVRTLVRRENAMLGTVDFHMPGDEAAVVFRTDPTRERGRLVFQLGSASPDTAVAAASVVARDVDGVDLNMGCPKKFSLQGGMGAALLKDPERAAAIVAALRAALPPRIAVSCKIRPLADAEATVALAQSLVGAGAQSIAVHLRTLDTPNTKPADWSLIRAVAEAVPVPVVANGSVFRHEDVAKVREAAGGDALARGIGVMVARGALINCSLFRAGAETLDVVVRRYLRECARTGNTHQNTKYTVQRMLQEAGAKAQAALGKHRTVRALCVCKSLGAIVNAWCGADPNGSEAPAGCDAGLGRDSIMGLARATEEREPARAADFRTYTDEYILDGRGEMGHGIGSAVVGPDDAKGSTGDCAGGSAGACAGGTPAPEPAGDIDQGPRGLSEEPVQRKRPRCESAIAFSSVSAVSGA